MRVGIDLGTTNTVVGYIDENGIFKILQFRSGRTGAPQFLPSCVAVRNDGWLVGQPAVAHGLNHPEECVSNTKYDMGNENKIWHIGSRRLNARKAAEIILKEVYLELSRQFPNEKTFNAFVTVPARFGSEARQATKDALHAAGFETENACLTDEPIAAAIAYSSVLDGDKLVLVVDIGGGTFDLSLMKATIVGSSVHPGRLEPVAWGGDLHLGGNDVDEILIKLMAKSFQQESGKNLYAEAGTIFARKEETRAAALLRTQAIRLKSQLYEGSAGQASISLADLLDGHTFRFQISKENYLEAMSPLAEKFSDCLLNLFAGSGYSAADVNHVLVVGGMAHEPCLLDILYQLFGRQNVIVPEDSMLLVAKGAAICNSNQRLHVENKAYTSIGLLEHNRTSVKPLICQGDVIRTGKIFEAVLSPSTAEATAMRIELVEYQGEFHPDTCTPILCETIQLTALKQDTLFHRLFHRSAVPKLKLQANFTEDKILQLKVIQADKNERMLDVRLGG